MRLRRPIDCLKSELSMQKKLQTHLEEIGL
jgi:hypothetical protein